MLLQNHWGCFCNTKNMCLKQAGGCFLFYYLLISIVLVKCFYCKFYRNFRQGCFLVYLANYKKLLRTAAFNLSSKTIHLKNEYNLIIYLKDKLTVDGIMVRL